MKAQDTTPEKQGLKPTKQELFEWLDQQILATIASIGEDGYPNAAAVGFSQTTNFEFVIISDKDSRKAQNIMQDERVALTITNQDDRYTLQVQGRARELSWDEFDKYSAYHYRKLPFSLPFKDIPGQIPFVIVPVYMRFSDVSVRPWELTEIPV